MTCWPYSREIHPGLFAVMDGTFAGDGPGPRAMRWHVKNRILASADQVAIDAVAAKMMGFDPMSIPFIRLAHERGLGCGEVADIDVRGEDISGVNWQFSGVENTFASRGQKLIYWGPAQAAGEYAAPQPHSRLGLLRLQPLPQRLLAKDQGPPPH